MVAASSYDTMGTSVARTAVHDRVRFRLGTAVAHRTAVLESRGRVRGRPDGVRMGTAVSQELKGAIHHGQMLGAPGGAAAPFIERGLRWPGQLRSRMLHKM